MGDILGFKEETLDFVFVSDKYCEVGEHQTKVHGKDTIIER